MRRIILGVGGILSCVYIAFCFIRDVLVPIIKDRQILLPTLAIIVVAVILMIWFCVFLYKISYSRGIRSGRKEEETKQNFINERLGRIPDILMEVYEKFKQ